MIKKNINKSATTFVVGFIGSGKTAEKHAEVIKTFKNYKLFSVFSKNLNNAEKFANKFKIENHYNNLNSFLYQKKYDLIIICLPPDQLLKILYFLKDLDTNIFTEKPLGLNLLEAKKILNLYKTRKHKKMKFFVGYNRRFLESVMQLKKLAYKNTSKLFIDIQDQQDLGIAASLGHNKEILDNWMYANSIHTIDFLNFLSKGKPIKIVSKRVFLKGSHIVTSNILFSNGDLARYICYWGRPASWSVVLSSDNKLFKLNPLEKLSITENKKIKIYEAVNFDKKFKPGFYYQFVEIDKAMRIKKNYAVGIFDAIKSVQLTNDIYENFTK